MHDSVLRLVFQEEVGPRLELEVRAGSGAFLHVPASFRLRRRRNLLQLYLNGRLVLEVPALRRVHRSGLVVFDEAIRAWVDKELGGGHSVLYQAVCSFHADAVDDDNDLLCNHRGLLHGHTLEDWVLRNLLLPCKLAVEECFLELLQEQFTGVNDEELGRGLRRLLQPSSVPDRSLSREALQVADGLRRGRRRG